MADWWQNQKPGKPGDPNCKRCGGEGVLLVEETFPPLYKSCVCMHYKEILQNVERGLPGLTRAPRLKKGVEGAFGGKTSQNLWITAPLKWFRAQLRWIMIRQAPNFWFKVTSDTELMRAWLGTVHMKGLDILDPDAHQISSRYMNLEDLIEPPDLLIIHLGVKKARNKSSPEVLDEALRVRAFRGKPTWVYNESHIAFDATMPSYSYEVESYLQEWERIERKSPKKSVQNPQGSMPDLNDLAPTAVQSQPLTTPASKPVVSSASRRTNRRGLGGGSGGSHSIGLPEIQPDRPRKKTNSKWRGTK